MSSQLLETVGLIEDERGWPRGQRAQGAHELAGCRYRKVGGERGAVGPLLEEHQPERILAVDMHSMGDAAGFLSRPMNMLEAQAARLVEPLGADRYAASHNDHAMSPDVISVRAAMPPGASLSSVPAASVSAPRVRPRSARRFPGPHVRTSHTHC